jgi:hypothetical protein
VPIDCCSAMVLSIRAATVGASGALIRPAAKPGVLYWAALYFGREVLVPIALALLLSFALAPITRFASRDGATCKELHAPSTEIGLLLLLPGRTGRNGRGTRVGALLCRTRFINCNGATRVARRVRRIDSGRQRSRVCCTGRRFISGERTSLLRPSKERVTERRKNYGVTRHTRSIVCAPHQVGATLPGRFRETDLVYRINPTSLATLERAPNETRANRSRTLFS